ncbi:MAG: adenylyltransferase/cytidyltransferase family protein [Deltaproteobacteria bacterium]|nr:adenylyltransferase/cytidyltransferase family protein [Deltaproteobacteria bacterium]
MSTHELFAGKILSVEALKAVREELRARGKRVVQCHGCFDIVHPGHIRYLRFAREQGDVLIVSVSADDVVGKGVDRPYINEDLRLENLAALEFVDYVCLDNHDWAGPVLEALEPDVYVKGKEYETNSDPRFARERELVTDYGGKVIFSSGDVVYSSTYIVNQFRHRFNLERQKVNFYRRQHQIDMEGLSLVLRRMAGQKVLVLGDAILDRYVHCEALGIAAESPILSVAPIREETYVGAAGLIARQLAALGAEATLLTVMGDDDPGRIFRTQLDAGHVTLLEGRVDRRPTFVKMRYLVDEKKVFKVDHGRYTPLSTAATTELLAIVDRELARFDGLVITDFGYGLFGPGFVAELPKICERHGRPYYVDVSQTGQANILKFERARLATPTEPELRLAFGDYESGLSSLATRYYAHTHAERLVLTLGRRGVLVFGPPEGKPRLKTDYLPALSQHAEDAVGAGDVMLSCLALADMAGAPISIGAYLGSAASALHVQRLGNAPVELGDLEGYLAELEAQSA